MSIPSTVFQFDDTLQPPRPLDQSAWYGSLEFPDGLAPVVADAVGALTGALWVGADALGLGDGS
jgi:hypothetical protein